MVALIAMEVTMNTTVANTIADKISTEQKTSAPSVCDPTPYYDALAHAHPHLLEELAEHAGHITALDVKDTLLFSVNKNPDDYWDSNGVALAYATAPSPRHQLAVLEQMKLTPLEDWNSRYTDMFTLLKSDPKGTRFVDSWATTGTHRLALACGIFPPEITPDSVLDKTAAVLYLSTIRSKYPPLVPWKEVVGISEQEPVLYFCMKRSLDLGAFTLAYAATQNVLAGIAAVGLAEYGLLKIKEAQRGIKIFNRMGVSLDNAAVDTLISDASASLF